MSEQKIAINGDQLQKMFDAVKDSIDASMSDKIGGLVIDIQTLKAQQEAGVSSKKIDELTATINGKISAMGEQFNQFVEDAKKNQPIIDSFIAETQKRKTESKEKGSFKNVWEEKVVKPLMENKDLLGNVRFGAPSQKFEIGKNDMKLEEKAIMTISNTLTGTGTITFNDRLGVLPAQAINFRDILSTANAGGNATYVTYRETNAVQSPGVQTEGSAKTNLQYTFSANTINLKYIAGFATFTKQLAYDINFLQNRLPQMLLRDFYKKENDYLFTTIASNSTGTSLPAGTLAKADAEELIQVIASQRGRNFNADYAIVDWTEWQRLLTTKPNDYSVPGGVMIDANGVIRIAGVPVIPAAWAQTDHALVYDSYFYERVEGEALNVQFSFENQDNFEKNQITVRIECFEELNRLRDDASIYYDFGNS